MDAAPDGVRRRRRPYRREAAAMLRAISIMPARPPSQSAGRQTAWKAIAATLAAIGL